MACRLFKDGKIPQSRTRSMIFLCGGADRSNREELKSYLQSRHGTRLGVFYAEDVWDQIKTGPQNSLEVEQRLAEAADMIVIVLESAGSIAELGAFSAHEELRSRLLPIIEKRFANDDSFINTGPIAWVNRDSRYAPAISTPFNPISLCAAELEERISRLPRYRWFPNQAVPEHAPKHALALVADLIALLTPATSGQLDAFFTRLNTPLPLDWTVPELVGLGVSMGLIQRHDTESAGIVYSRVFDARSLESRFSVTAAVLHRSRGAILSALQRVPVARQCLLEVANG